MGGSSSGVGFRGVTLVTSRPILFTDLTDTPATITALGFVRGNAGGTALEFVAASAAITLQNAYDASTSPEITLDATRGALTIRDNATPVGNVLECQNDAGDSFFDVDPTELNFGIAGNREFELTHDPIGYGGLSYMPDGRTRTGGLTQSALIWISTVTTNVAGGGGIGNDSAPAMINAQGTCIFADPGNLFSSALMFNQATQIRAQANVGPSYTMVNQPRFIADGGSRTQSQANAVRSQQAVGPNINGGSATLISHEPYFATINVDATVGTASATTVNYFAPKAPNLIAGGTIGTLNLMDFPNISAVGITTLNGIRSAMSSGAFINHTGTAAAIFGGVIQLGTDWQIVRLAANIATLGTGDSLRISTGNLLLGANGTVQVTSQSAGVLRMIAAGLTNNEGLDWDFDTATANEVAVTSPTGAGLTLNLGAVSIGTTAGDPTANWQFILSPGAKTVTLGGDFSRALFTAAANVTLDAAMTNGFSWIVNEPSLVLGTGSVVNAGVMLIQGSINIGTNRCGLLITSNPTGGTLNHALRVTLGASRFDGRVDINNGIALGGGAAATLGTIGGSGPTAAAQAQWVEIDIAGTPHWIAVWT